MTETAKPSTGGLQVEGPIAGPVPMAHGAYPLAATGYVEQEFFLAGTARSFELIGERAGTGRWVARPSGTAPFKTRVVVRRPSEGAGFNGTVHVEWLNVSGNTDAAPDWSCLHREIMRRGAAWVGVSAQKVGIDGGGFAFVPDASLKKLAPERYSTLQHPGDAFSYDIFTQAARCVLAGSEQGVLGSLRPQRVLAQGESQSAAFLVTYVNAIDPLERVFDGFLVHGRGASGAGLDGFRLIRDADQNVDLESVRRSQAPEQIRSDARVPVLVLQSETDVVNLGGGRPGQDDGDRIRLWEVAGAAHADSYLLVAAAQDSGSLSPEELAAHLNAVTLPAPMATDQPINSGPQQHYVGQAALRHLERWVTDGVAPPHAARLEPDGDGLALDDAGNARGGVRTPWVDVPLAVLTGLGQTGDGFAFLFGRTAPFDAATRSRLYPGGKADYLTRFRAALQSAIDAGFLLEDDRTEIEGLAAASWPA